jgi:hypothetical protein
MKRGRVTGYKIRLPILEGLYSNMSTLEQFTNTYHSEEFTKPFGYFSKIADASGTTTYNPNSQTTAGTYGGYLFDYYGLEIEQIIEKGMFGAMLYKYAFDKLNEPVTFETIDKVLAVYGSNPSFPNTPTANNTPQPDVFIANYAARRSDINNPNSFYKNIQNGFIKLQNGVRQNNNTLLDEGKAEILINWEKANAATVINYCHSVITTMSKTTTTSQEKASVLHAASEAAGFIWGFKGIANGVKIIKDTEIDAIFNIIGQLNNYKIVTQPATELPKIQQIITQLQTIYGFTSSEIEDFKLNYVSVQNR